MSLAARLPEYEQLFPWHTADAPAFSGDWQPSPRWYVSFKAAVEFLAALVMLVFATPLIVVAGLLMKLTSRGPVFYCQTRLGRFGKPYTIYKIRTMAEDAERVGGAQWATEDDPRITPVGRFLRRTHLDELPQLWNVLRGDMSLVGPRPERPEFATGLARALPHYWDRLLVRPGVTGLAQVQLPADTDLASVRRKLAYDLYYVRELNLWLDLRIIGSTALKVFGVRFEVLRRLFRIPARATVEEAYGRLRGELTEELSEARSA
jgi:lipopolysaccharide/colanic/teichoic acid biosynthesis glycosyltransferase